LLLAAALRFWALGEVPPGLAHDEVTNWLIARDILAGHHAIYFTAAYGHEPLYQYVQAATVALFGDHWLGLRYPSAAFGMLGLAVTYVLIRRLFGAFARLRGYALDGDTVQPGERFCLTLYWEALEPAGRSYALFVHVLNDQDIIVAQRDTHPGLGTYPTRAWQTGCLFADVIPIDVPETACTPDDLYLSVGFYEHGGNLRVPATADGERLVNDAVPLGSLALLARPGSFPNALDLDFYRRIALRGYTLDRRVLRPGEALHLTLYWQALTPIDENYTVFAHLLGEGAQVWGSGDGWPVDGQIPTATWTPGQIITDTHTITVGATTPTGLYDLEMGWLDADGDRLPIVAADGHLLGQRVLLCKIRVER